MLRRNWDGDNGQLIDDACSVKQDLYPCLLNRIILIIDVIFLAIVVTGNLICIVTE